jgi:hypothetical protein
VINTIKQLPDYLILSSYVYEHCSSQFSAYRPTPFYQHLCSVGKYIAGAYVCANNTDYQCLTVPDFRRRFINVLSGYADPFIPSAYGLFYENPLSNFHTIGPEPFVYRVSYSCTGDAPPLIPQPAGYYCNDKIISMFGSNFDSLMSHSDGGSSAYTRNLEFYCSSSWISWIKSFLKDYSLSLRVMLCYGNSSYHTGLISYVGDSPNLPFDIRIMKTPNGDIPLSKDISQDLKSGSTLQRDGTGHIFVKDFEAYFTDSGLSIRPYFMPDLKPVNADPIPSSVIAMPIGTPTSRPCVCSVVTIGEIAYYDGTFQYVRVFKESTQSRWNLIINSDVLLDMAVDGPDSSYLEDILFLVPRGTKIYHGPTCSDMISVPLAYEKAEDKPVYQYKFVKDYSIWDNINKLISWLRTPFSTRWVVFLTDEIYKCLVNVLEFIITRINRTLRISVLNTTLVAYAYIRRNSMSILETIAVFFIFLLNVGAIPF